MLDRAALAVSQSREPFDQLGYELLSRGGRMAEQVVASVQRTTPPAGLTLNAAVIGGLLVRTGKQVRGIFDSTQAEESEAHHVLSRTVTETAVTLTYLARHGDDAAFRLFRADSFAYWRKQLDGMRAASDREDAVARGHREKLEAHTDRWLRAAGLTWDDVPTKSNSWGPDMRQRCDAIGEGWIYGTLLASHSNYVQPTWHELRTFHLSTQDGAVGLDATYGGMLPIAAYVVARVVAGACGAAQAFLPSDLDPTDMTERVDGTVRASQELALEFSDFMARGGVDEDLRRHDEPSGDAPSE